MSPWWYIVAIVVVLAAVVFLALRARRRGGVEMNSASDPSRNYSDERETSRVGGMSDEDRAWEAASLERNRQAQEQKEPPRVDD